MLEDIDQDPKDASCDKEQPRGELKGPLWEHALWDPSLVHNRMLNNLWQLEGEATSQRGPKQREAAATMLRS